MPSLVRNAKVRLSRGIDAIKVHNRKSLTAAAKREYEKIQKLLQEDSMTPDTITRIANLKTRNFDKFLENNRDALPTQ